ncbi:MAG TPA: hypothetical protein PKG52_01940 [bacterium]|nr:hypothetical protein [bacterium]HPS29055.1 hypothetical protein [bacterium]
MSVTSCIALKKDVDAAKVENNEKIKIVEDYLKEEITKINKRLDDIEKALQDEKSASDNKMSLSFSTLDELKSTIKDLNSRIDMFDVKTQKGGVSSEKVLELEKRLVKYEEENEKLKKDMQIQMEDLKPVENMTVTKSGSVKLPDNEEKSYNQLVDFTKSATDGETARKGWEVYSQKFPKGRRCDVVYWTGESYFLDKSYNNAIQSFQRIEAEFESCAKLESSYIKTAFSLFYIGKADVASKVLDAVAIKFPKSAFPDQIKELKKLISDKKTKSKPAKKNNKNDTKKGGKK